MPPDPLARQWLRLAGQDVAIAERAVAGDAPLIEPACFHCQQAVEKYLKGYLQHRASLPPKTHSLDLLFDLCEQLDSAFASLRNECAWLSEFGVFIRYPGFQPIPTVAETQTALEAARKARDFVLARVLPEVHP